MPDANDRVADDLRAALHQLRRARGLSRVERVIDDTARALRVGATVPAETVADLLTAVVGALHNASADRDEDEENTP